VGYSREGANRSFHASVGSYVVERKINLSATLRDDKPKNIDGKENIA
jgi:hypothetical protein